MELEKRFTTVHENGMKTSTNFTYDHLIEIYNLHKDNPVKMIEKMTVNCIDEKRMVLHDIYRDNNLEKCQDIDKYLSESIIELGGNPNDYKFNK